MKKDRGGQKNLDLDNLEEETIKQFSKLASLRSKKIIPSNKKYDVHFYLW